MKIQFLLLLCACSGAYAQSHRLPPIVDNSSYVGGSAYKASAPVPAANATFEVLGRLEQMQAEIQQLRGIVEEQSQTIDELKRRQSNIYSDLEQRIQEISQGRNRNVQNISTVDNYNKQPDQFDAPNTENNLENRQDVVEYPVPAQDSMVIPARTVTATPKNTATYNVSGRDQKALYQDAYETLRNGHNTRAISAFKALLSEFPNGEYADNSLYWLGEAYKVNQDLNSAKAAFTKIITHFGGSPKVPDALLKLGYIELEQNNTLRARDYLTQVTNSYPGSPAANLAADKLLQMRVMQP